MNQELSQLAIYKGRKHIDVNECSTLLCNKVNNDIQKIKNNKLIKIDGKLDVIPGFKDYDWFTQYKYNLKQLKQISKEYKLKSTGNKEQLILRIYTFLYSSYNAVKIQKILRGCLQRKYDITHGPGYRNRKICSNTFDFLSMEELTNIPKEQFFSFKDEDNFIYGFDAISLQNLICKTDGIIKNPFNTKPLNKEVIEKFKTMLRISKVLKIKILTEIDDITKDVTNKKLIELKALELFQTIDSLGNYTDVKWFNTLPKNKLIRFIRELIDIWVYRANLDKEIKRSICPPNGNPFIGLPDYNILDKIQNIDDLRKIILVVLNKFVNDGINKDSKCLGAYYILCALTLVNTDAATSLPWLYDAAYYM